MWSGLYAILMAGLILSGSSSAFAEPIPGDSCASYPAGSFMTSGGPELNGDVWHMICDGGLWADIFDAPPVVDACVGSPDIGTLCADGSVYAGLTGDGGGPIYAMPCDLGMTWTGSGCSGSRTRMVWGGFEVDITGATSSVTGEANTDYLAGLGPSAHPAARVCYNLDAHGHDDWYLPALNELVDLYARHTLGVFAGTYSTVAGSDGFYWSSTRDDTPGDIQTARPVQFSDGTPAWEWRNNTFVVRCIRKGA